MTIENWKYDEFVKANNGNFSVLDFIHAVSEKIPLPYDFILCLGRLFAPKLTVFDGIIVAADWFDEKRYREYQASGMVATQAQAWINMVEITDIFNDISPKNAEQLATFIANLWTERIRAEFPSERVEANVVIDDGSNEVFVTIGAFQSA